jgi:hypothetical protein
LYEHAIADFLHYSRNVVADLQMIGEEGDVERKARASIMLFWALPRGSWSLSPETMPFFVRWLVKICQAEDVFCSMDFVFLAKFWWFAKI